MKKTDDIMSQIRDMKKKPLESSVDFKSSVIPDFLKQNEGRLTRGESETRLEMIGGDDSE